MRNLLNTLRCWVASSSVEGREPEPLLSSTSETSVIAVGDGEASLRLSSRSCSTRPSNTETMIAASRVSRKTMKKMGTENRFLPILGRLEAKRGHCAVEFKWSVDGPNSLQTRKLDHSRPRFHKGIFYVTSHAKEGPYLITREPRCNQITPHVADKMEAPRMSVLSD